MCIANEVCPICGKKGKQAKLKWYDWGRQYFNILRQCGNPHCKNFGKTYIYEKFNWNFPDHHRTPHCEEHDKTAEVVEARRSGLTVVSFHPQDTVPYLARQKIETNLGETAND